MSTNRPTAKWSKNKIILVIICLAVVVAVWAVIVLTGGDDKKSATPDPTPSGSIAVTIPGVVGSSPTPDTTEDPQPSSSHIHESGDGDVDLGESAWGMDEGEEEHDHAAEDGSDEDVAAWMTMATEFGQAFTNTSVGYEAWIANLSRYLSADMLIAYSDPIVMDNIAPGELLGVDVVSSGGTQQQVNLRYTDPNADARIVINPSGNEFGWEVGAVGQEAG